MARKEPETVYPPGTTYQLANISESGQAPRTRLTDAKLAAQIASRLIDEDNKQNASDAQVFRMVTGCPPFNAALLERASQSWRANFSSRIARSYLASALTQVWDVIASAHPKCHVTVDSGNVGQEKAVQWSKVITEEFERLNEQDREDEGKSRALAREPLAIDRVANFAE